MGNTCASVHIATRRSLDDVSKAVARCYGKLGYERVKRAPDSGGKHVILQAATRHPYVSVYDSDNAGLDNGELKDLALAVSKVLKTAAVFTSLYDSDTYEFVVFASGRQVDLLMTDEASYAGPLKRLSGKSRATKWSTLFGRAISADQISQAASQQSVFADGILGDLSELVGISEGQAQINYQDLLDEKAAHAQLYFKKKPVIASEAPAGEIRLTNAFDPDDTRMLHVYPASWPIPVGKRPNVKWMVLSEGAGFDGGIATIRVSGLDGPVLSRGAMKGFKFHNGQIVGDLETRPTDQDHVKDYYAFEVVPFEPAASGSQAYKAEFRRLAIPPMTSGRTTQILILFVLYDLQLGTAGEWEINVALEPRGQGEYVHALPPVRIAAVDQGWVPVVSGLNPKTTYDKSNFSTDPRTEQDYVRELEDKQPRVRDDRRLIHPAIASSVAILNDDGQTTLTACQNWLKTWLSPLQERRQGQIHICTEKKLPPLVFKASKTKKSLPSEAFLQDKAWANLFDYEKNYQSVLISFVPNDSELPVAGIGLQYSHEKHYFPGYPIAGNEYSTQMAKTLTALRGRPFGEEPYRSTLHAFAWVTNRSDCLQYLKTSVEDMRRQLDRFAAANAPLQAWNSQSTWVPLFDQAAQGRFTVYEDVSVLNWFRGAAGGGLHRRMMSAQWCGNVLRMVAPHMWLCRNLIDQVDREALERVAQVMETGGTYRIVLHAGRTMDELELALLPVLPIESARISLPGSL